MLGVQLLGCRRSCGREGKARARDKYRVDRNREEKRGKRGEDVDVPQCQTGNARGMVVGDKRGGEAGLGRIGAAV